MFANYGSGRNGTNGQLWARNARGAIGFAERMAWARKEWRARVARGYGPGQKLESANAPARRRGARRGIGLAVGAMKTVQK